LVWQDSALIFVAVIVPEIVNHWPLLVEPTARHHVRAGHHVVLHLREREADWE
jgi:hypothetical protein